MIKMNKYRLMLGTKDKLSLTQELTDESIKLHRPDPTVSSQRFIGEAMVVLV
jgi:hypothetical protein